MLQGIRALADCQRCSAVTQIAQALDPSCTWQQHGLARHNPTDTHANLDSDVDTPLPSPQLQLSASQLLELLTAPQLSMPMLQQTASGSAGHSIGSGDGTDALQSAAALHEDEQLVTLLQFDWQHSSSSGAGTVCLRGSLLHADGRLLTAFLRASRRYVLWQTGTSVQ